MATNETRRTRTRPVKTPTRLVEEIHTNNNNNSIKTIEPDTNVFDILSSPTTIDTISNNEPTENSQQLCTTYNVIISNKPNKLGLTIKKVVQPWLCEREIIGFYIIAILSTTYLCIYFDYCYYCLFVFFFPDGQIDHIDYDLSIYLSFFFWW